MALLRWAVRRDSGNVSERVRSPGRRLLRHRGWLCDQDRLWGSLNSTVSIGIFSAHVLGGGAFVNGLVYIVFELVGGALAAGMFKSTHVAECVPKEYGARNMSFKRSGWTDSSHEWCALS